MRSLRIALGQINPTVGDLEGNLALARETVERARERGADLVALPELALTGYPPEDLLMKPSFVEGNLACLRRLVECCRDITVIVGFVDAADDIYNAAAVIDDGKLLGVYHKNYLPNYGVFDEDRYFRAGQASPVFHLPGAIIGVSICEDIWYPTGPATLQAAAGAELIININASPYQAGKRRFREKMLATRAADNGVNVAYVNAVGGQDELVFDGHSLVFDERGDLLAQGRQFEEDLVVVDLNLEGVFRTRLHDPRRRKERLAALAEPTSVPVIAAGARDRQAVARSALAPREATPLDDVAEVYAALVLGTRDYVRKNGFRKVVLGLSGGIDSSLTAALAVDALGAENVVGVSMPSRFSSRGSRVDARRLAANLGIRLMTIPIEGPHRAYLRTLAPVFGEAKPDVTEENLQARVRGNLLMALSNKFGWLVLTTGNKSEMSTGYSTLYGDSAGGFAVIKDVPKTMVYRLAAYRNARGDGSVIPEIVLTKEPSAELRPNQLDSDSLPPYPVLDPILRAYVEEDRSLEEILALGYDEPTARRVIALVDRSEYKRRQAPPGIKITPRALGRDRRWPITNRYPGE